MTLKPDGDLEVKTEDEPHLRGIDISYGNEIHVNYLVEQTGQNLRGFCMETALLPDLSFLQLERPSFAKSYFCALVPGPELIFPAYDQNTPFPLRSLVFAYVPPDRVVIDKEVKVRRVLILVNPLSGSGLVRSRIY